MSETPRIVVTVCTYNERENVATLLPAIRQHLPAADVLVVDDSSPDGTADVVRGLAANDQQIDVLVRREKNGLGAATLAGFREALHRGYDLVINMDADWSHPPAVLPALVAGMSDADVMVASRYVPGGGVQGWPLKRRFMSWGINHYSRVLLGLTARDCSGAYRCYRAELLKKIGLDRFRSMGYAFQEEMLFRCQQAGGRIRETPFVFVDREIGQSKINVREIVRALKDIAALGAGRVAGRSQKPTSQNAAP